MNKTPRLNPTEKRFLEQVRTRRLVERGERVLLAVSGGPDSMALLILFMAVRRALGCTLAVVHCNFTLRGAESDGDEAFVRRSCESLGLPCFVRRFDTLALAGAAGRSVEEEARELRYGYFRELLEKEGYTKVATGHHTGDNAETMLFNMFRGSSLPSLRGIRSRRGQIIRPLLFMQRGDIEAYLGERGVESRFDASNADDRYDRNFIRNRLIPLIEERFPGRFRPAMQRLSEQSGELEEFLEGYFERLLRKNPGLSAEQGWLDVGALRRLTLFERKEVFKRSLSELGLPVDAAVLDRLTSLLGTQPGRRVELSEGMEAVWKGGRVCFLSRLP
ncbi:tRNA lysidine(34) synthetase TilS [Chlorobium sp. N1]|uniref:tRNA lysidine(34) synthetase TilS n=1 Tax=Chlorobium sp. N1 TaxID=2491138 RepID=UPI00103B5C52|nr:tRNA lysidine(34) synthetase TilS [Chlorobium sp. N1]TCD48738.1 tRNA lysidine(34) synthetase TilS [Chlorobium sp. N1]